MTKKTNISIFLASPDTKTQPSDWDEDNNIPNVKALDGQGKVIGTLYEKRINDVPQANEIHQTIKSIHKLIVVVIPFMIISFVFEATYLRELSYMDIFNRSLSIYICIGTAFQLNDSINNQPYDPLLMFTWIKKKVFLQILKKILALKSK